MSTTTDYEREVIVEYWYRTLLSVSLSFDDITKIIIEFGKAFERFERSLMTDNMKVNENGTILSQTDFHWQFNSAFGSFNAFPGNKYHWKMKILQSGKDDDPTKLEANVGIIPVDMHEQALRKPRVVWCCIGYGYAYYSDDGKKYHDNYTGSNYGKKYKPGDIIDIHLDLKDNYNVSWGKNSKDYGKGFDLEKKEYKLAIGIYFGKIQLLSLEITE